MDRSAAIRDIAGALQGLQNQCAFSRVDNAVYTDFVMLMQVVQYCFWQQSHLIICFRSGEALHLQHGTSPSFLAVLVGFGELRALLVTLPGLGEFLELVIFLVVILALCLVVFSSSSFFLSNSSHLLSSHSSHTKNSHCLNLQGLLCLQS